jgi:hypothetical protein
MAETELRDFPSIFSLKGKVVVVTGGSRGLGLHAASGSVDLPAYSQQIHKLTNEPDFFKRGLQKSTSRPAKPQPVTLLLQL